MKLVERLKADFGQFLFVPSEISRWSPEEMTVFYSEKNPMALLHELGHAVCGHKSFTQDVELVHIELDAWAKAQKIGVKYGVKISDEQIEQAMDDYRDWLHERSVCPECRQNGLQSRADSLYRCLNCGVVWNSNDARQTALRRSKRPQNAKKPR